MHLFIIVNRRAFSPWKWPGEDFGYFNFKRNQGCYTEKLSRIHYKESNPGVVQASLQSQKILEKLSVTLYGKRELAFRFVPFLENS